MCVKKRVYHRVTISLLQGRHYLLKLPTPILIEIDHPIKKRGYIRVVAKERDVRKQFAV